MKWGYKTVHFELKKEGLLGGAFLDETEIEQELNEYGRAGWELISVLEVQDGVIAFFKQPLGLSPVRSRGVREGESGVISPEAPAAVRWRMPDEPENPIEEPAKPPTSRDDRDVPRERKPKERDDRADEVEIQTIGAIRIE